VRYVLYYIEISPSVNDKIPLKQVKIEPKSQSSVIEKEMPDNFLKLYKQRQEIIPLIKDCKLIRYFIEPPNSKYNIEFLYCGKNFG